MNQDKPIVVTLGCRLNSYESSYIETILKTLHMYDFIVVNTCTITNESEKQSRQEIRKIKRENPNKKVIVTGCASQLHFDFFSSMPEVEFVISNSMKKKRDCYHKISEFYKTNLENKEELQKYLFSNVDENDHENREKFIIENFQRQSRSRAFIEIQNGCNHYCSFCIVPFVRGKMKSRTESEITEEIKLLIENGYNEVVLTGVDITDYGTDLYGNRKLSDLCQKILDETNLKRLRLSSIDVAEIDEKLIEIFKNNKRFMPYFHISLQSGSDSILKKMRRRHTREQVYHFVEKVRKIDPKVGIGADVICGFANETEYEFDDSLKLIQECKINFLHAFPYSKKEKTLASRWPDDIHKTEKKKRVHILQDAAKKNFEDLQKIMIGNEYLIVLERSKISGKAENFMDIFFKEPKCEFNPSDILKVRCTHIEDSKLFAELIEKC